MHLIGLAQVSGVAGSSAPMPMSSATASMMEAEEKLFDAARRGQALACEKDG